MWRLMCGVIGWAWACAGCGDAQAGGTAGRGEGAGDLVRPLAEESGGSPYDFLRQGGVSTDDLPATWGALPYASFSLSRGGCYGTCPIDTVTFTRGSGVGNGSAEYEGQAYVEREGSFVGEIDLFDYGRLCELFDALGFERLEPNYAANWTDDETVVVSATVDSETYRVEDYGHQGPPELVALQLALEAITERIDWEPASGPNPAAD